MSDQAAPVLIHGDATPADIGVPAGLDAATASTESVFKAFASIPDDAVKPAPDPAPGTEVKTEAAPTTETKAPEVPPEFLGISKEATPDPLEADRALLKERPKGPIKHDHFTTVQTAAERLVAEAEKRATDALARAEAAEKQRGVPNEEASKKLEQLQQERDDYLSRLERQAAKDSPRYKQQFTDPKDAISSRLANRAKELGVDSETVENALRSSFKRRLEIVDSLEIGETAKSALTHIMEQHDAITQQEESFLAKSREELTAWQQQEKAQAEAHDKQRAEVESRVFKEVSEGMRTRFAPFQRVEGNAAWNAQAEALEAEAAKYYNGQVPLKDLAEVVHYGLGARVLEEKIIPALRAQNKALSDENARLKVGQPSANGAQPNGRVGQPDQSHMTPEERAMDTFRRAQAGALNNGFEQFRP